MAMMNCVSIPTSTVRHLMNFLLRDVAHSTKMNTSNPNKLTARFERVLSWLSAGANAPIRNTPTTTTAPSGRRSFSDRVS